MNFFANLTTGKLIMIISVLMFITLLYFFIRDFYGKVLESAKGKTHEAKPVEPVVVALLYRSRAMLTRPAYW